MLILRLVLILTTLLLVVSGGLYLFTGNQRYLNFAWQTVRFTALLLIVFALLFILERYVLVAWRVLL
ncbi:MAG: hypothetical protein R8K48_01600 [Gallionella sp.]